jgi:FkbM family methyltransferase
LKNIKAFIYSVLCNAFTGYLISTIFKRSVPDIRWKKYLFALDQKIVTKKTIAAIFFGFYESAEIRFIEKYLNGNLNVIELGSSIGIVSSHIARKLKSGTKFIMVEANPVLPEIIRANIDRHISKDVSYRILNYAISYGTENVFLQVAHDNTDTRVSKNPLNTNSGIMVRSKTLTSILKEFDINEYAIVCDIEGSEVEWLTNEDISLKNCKQLLVELHNTDYGIHFTIDDIKDLITKKHNFKLVDNRGPVYYFNK